MKIELEALLRRALAALAGERFPREVLPAETLLERSREPAHGDFATSVALTLARHAGKKPRELAADIVRALPASALIAKTEIAGPGFINFFLAPDAYHGEVRAVLAQGAGYGRVNAGRGERVLVEFVSANPTGPLHVGHGRNAAYGDSLSNLLAAAGYAVEREYYINDAGRQTDILTVSVWLRYLELEGVALPFPAAGYPGDYVRAIAEKLRAQHASRLARAAAKISAGLPADAPAGDKDEHMDALIARAKQLLGGDYAAIQRLALEEELADIRATLERFQVRFDRWYSERELVARGAVEHACERLEKAGHLYRKDGALWLKTTDLGDEKDRVLIKEDGSYTYFASDVAYHVDKLERGFDTLINVWGADHHGYIARVRAAIAALAGRADRFQVQLIQFVTLSSGRMGKRSGNFVTLKGLLDDLGTDAARFFYLMRSHDQHLEFDQDLARAQSSDNPVYYVQYAHARVASVFRQLAEKGLAWDRARGEAQLPRLTESHERSLMVGLSRFPEMVETAARQRAPHLMVQYLRELANDFHAYYNAHPFIVEEAGLRDARLALVRATQQVIRNGLALLGVSAPESM